MPVPHSVASYTPVTLRANGEVVIIPIEDVVKYGACPWNTCHGGKEACELLGVEAWTEQGWTKVHRVIRHLLPPFKRMVRIITEAGMVDVTDDHSLLLADGTPVSPRRLSIDDRLMHHPTPPFKFDDDLYHHSTMHHVDRKMHMRMMLESQDPATQSLTHVHVARVLAGITYAGDEVKDFTTTRIEYLEQNGPVYVYDLTTDNHHFAAGIGALIVHNTDSIFCTVKSGGLTGTALIQVGVSSPPITPQSVP